MAKRVVAGMVNGSMLGMKYGMAARVCNGERPFRNDSWIRSVTTNMAVIAVSETRKTLTSSARIIRLMSPIPKSVSGQPSTVVIAALLFFA